MTIKPKSGILVVTKNDTSTVSTEMYIAESDDDKRLITCTVVAGNDKYNIWEIVITGRYSLYQLAYKGDNYFFLDEEDVIGSVEKDV